MTQQVLCPPPTAVDRPFPDLDRDVLSTDVSTVAEGTWMKLDSKSETFTQVVQLFAASAPAGYQVMSVSRLHHPKLLERYMAAKIQRHLTPAGRAYPMWHGTGASSAISIGLHGYSMDRVRRGGAIFAADTAAFAHTYAYQRRKSACCNPELTVILNEMVGTHGVQVASTRDTETIYPAYKVTYSSASASQADRGCCCVIL